MWYYQSRHIEVICRSLVDQVFIVLFIFSHLDVSVCRRARASVWNIAKKKRSTSDASFNDHHNVTGEFLFFFAT